MNGLVKPNVLNVSVFSFLQTGLFKLSEEEFFIQPLETSSAETSAPQAHAIYKRHASPPVHRPVVQPISGKPGLNGTCGNQSKSRLIAYSMHFYLTLFRFHPFEFAVGN